MTEQVHRTRVYHAARYAIQTLEGVAETSTDEEVLRKAAFSLLSAFQAERIESSAQMLLKEAMDGDKATDPRELDLSDKVHEEADRLSIYTADNFAAIIGSDHEDEAFDNDFEASSCNDTSSLVQVLAFYANKKDLEEALDSLKDDLPDWVDPNAPCTECDRDIPCAMCKGKGCDICYETGKRHDVGRAHPCDEPVPDEED